MQSDDRSPSRRKPSILASLDVEGEELAPELEATLRRVGAHLRTVPTPAAELDDRVMAAIRHSPRWRLRAALGWWLQPRSVSISPLGGLCATAAVAALLLVAPRLRPVDHVASPPAPRLSSSADRVHVVRFVLSAPGASRVHLVGDFNQWSREATALRPVGDAGVWTVEVPLAPGRHEYAFIVDGQEWRLDPSAPRALTDDYGSANSVITVGEAYRS